jgi:hypothetical protein
LQKISQSASVFGFRQMLGPLLISPGIINDQFVFPLAKIYIRVVEIDRFFNSLPLDFGYLGFAIFLSFVEWNSASPGLQPCHNHAILMP